MSIHVEHMMTRNFLMLLGTWQEEVGAKKIAKKTVKDP